MGKALRRFEARLGINRGDRTVWVWAVPPAMGIVVAIVFGVVADIGVPVGIAERLIVAVFGFVSMTLFAGISIAWFSDSEYLDNDEDHSPQ